VHTLVFRFWGAFCTSLFQVIKVVVNWLTTLHLRIILGNAFVQHKLSKVYCERVIEFEFALKIKIQAKTVTTDI